MCHFRWEFSKIIALHVYFTLQLHSQLKVQSINRSIINFCLRTVANILSHSHKKYVTLEYLSQQRSQDFYYGLILDLFSGEALANAFLHGLLLHDGSPLPPVLNDGPQLPVVLHGSALPIIDGPASSIIFSLHGTSTLAHVAVKPVSEAKPSGLSFRFVVFIKHRPKPT